MKIYFESGAFLPTDVLTLIGDESYHRQASLYVIAKSRNAGTAVLAATGMTEHVAASHLKESRILASPPNDLAAAVEAGVIDLDIEGVYVFGMNRGRGVVALTQRGPTLIGTLRYVAGRPILSATTTQAADGD